MNRFDLQLFAVDTKTVKSADLAKVRDVDFTEQFVAGIQTLMTMLGVTRKLEKKAGETLKVYKVTGTLESGTVAEGEVIPLSKYTTSYTPIDPEEVAQGDHRRGDLRKGLWPGGERHQRKNAQRHPEGHPG